MIELTGQQLLDLDAQPQPPVAIDPRTGQEVDPHYANWTTHPNNPMRAQAAE
jgi:hypothetical protein